MKVYLALGLLLIVAGANAEQTDAGHAVAHSYLIGISENTTLSATVTLDDCRPCVAALVLFHADGTSVSVYGWSLQPSYEINLKGPVEASVPLDLGDDPGPGLVTVGFLDWEFPESDREALLTIFLTQASEVDFSLTDGSLLGYDASDRVDWLVPSQMSMASAQVVIPGASLDVKASWNASEGSAGFLDTGHEVNVGGYVSTPDQRGMCPQEQPYCTLEFVDGPGLYETGMLLHGDPFQYVHQPVGVWADIETFGFESVFVT